MNFAKFVATVGLVLSIAASAEATTSTFGGTSSADTILVGRAYYGSLRYVACINGEWVWGNYVTGSSDYVYVSGYDGSDTISVRNVNDIYTCGGVNRWLYRMDYYYACPYRLYLLGGNGIALCEGWQEHPYHLQRPDAFTLRYFRSGDWSDRETCAWSGQSARVGDRS